MLDSEQIILVKNDNRIPSFICIQEIFKIFNEYDYPKMKMILAENIIKLSDALKKNNNRLNLTV